MATPPRRQRSSSQRTVQHVLSTYGCEAVSGMVAIESLGVPFPGETTLIAAALHAGATGKLDIWLVNRGGGRRDRDPLQQS